jgi:hypothetical protein
MESIVLFEDELLKPFSEMKVEDLYEITDSLLEDIDDTILKAPLGLQERVEIKEKQLRSSRRICIYLSELYRRNLLKPTINWFNISPLICPRCRKVFEKEQPIYTFQYNPEIPYHPDYICCYTCTSMEKCIKLYTKEESLQFRKNDETDKLWNVLFSAKETIKKDYSTLKTIKAFMIESVKTTLINREINGLIDAILDSNGNKISEFKEYLKPNHYRLIRAGCDVSEWSIKDQEELLADLKQIRFV